MISEAEGWSCFRSSATATAPPPPPPYSSSSEAACSAYFPALNCPPFSHYFRTNDFRCDLFEDSSLASTKQRRYWSNKYLHRSSFHEVESSCAASSVYSSCPSVRCESSDQDEPCLLPPTPPPRRAESFLCVAQHLRQRAQEAKQYYSGLLQRVLLDQRKKSDEQMAALTDTQAQNDASSQSVVASDEKHGVTLFEAASSAQNGLTTPTFTPPPPIDATHEHSNQTNARNDNGSKNESLKPLMFVYSYDPPTPDRPSEYDPPFPNFVQSANKNVNSKQERDKHANTHNNNCRPESDLSSSTLTATLLLTEDSDVSPLPPHAIRVSPMNTDTLTPSTPQAHHIATTDPAATYTCTSPAYSNYSDANPLSTDLSSISLNNFPDVRHAEASPRKTTSPDESEALGGKTPDTICVSPLQSERCTHSHSKTSDEPSLPTQSLSDSLKPSNEGASDPTTNASSDRARRSSPPSSPDPSLSSLPSDTITMNAAIDSIGTDSDPNDNSTWSTGNVTRDSSSRQSHHETDHASDSAFASPSMSPTFSKSCTITPVLVERQDLVRENVGEINKDPLSDEKAAIPVSNRNVALKEQRFEAESEIDYADETTESESIYPESECDIRLLSRADTEGLDSVHRDSSPERQTTPIIAEICNFEADSDSSKSTNLLQPSEIHNRTLNEISSSGNSSMSNSPALSSEFGVHSLRRLNQEEVPQSSAHNSHLSNWLNENERSYNLTPGYILSISGDLPDANYPSLSHQTSDVQEGGVLIEELSSETPVSSAMNGVVRSFSYFGPLPTIHEVVDTPTDITPANEVPPFSPVDPVNSSFSSVDAHSNSSIISCLVHSDSPQDVSTTGSSPMSKNTPVPLPTPPPPPRVMHTPLKTPPIPPPPSDEDAINPHPLPPLPSEEACLPPLPPLPITFTPDSPPPIPAHAPTPPQRMYLLIPLAPGHRSPRRMPSPPPAPPRSTSLRRSPPPPPPRSAVQTPSSAMDLMSVDRNGFRMGDITENDLEEDGNRSPSTSSDVGSVICVSKLTPVPEEKSNNSSPLPKTLLVASSENLSISSKGSTSPEYREITNLEDTQTEIINRSRQSPQPLLCKTSNFFPNSILPVPSSVFSGSSPPPPTPPRGKINLTPPLPPLPPPPKLIFTDDSTANSCKLQRRPDQSINNNMKRLDSRDKTTSPTPERPAPPPPPPPKLKQTKCSVSAVSSSPKEQTDQSLAARASPLLSVSNYGKLVVDRSDIVLPPPDEEIGRVFSSGVRWGWLTEGVDTIAMYTQLRPIIQHGPQCGLVALSMASQLCGASGSSTRRPSISNASTPGGGVGTPTTPSSVGLCGPTTTVSAADLLEAARAAGFSTHGEMFSADSLAQLANHKLGGAIEAVVRKNVLSDKHLFLELILSGALLLVPYDSQHNHQPGKFSGHKAHWCVVSGALVQSEHFASGPCTAAAFARPDARIDSLWHVRRGYHNPSTPASRPTSRGPSRAGGGGDDAQRQAGQHRDMARRDRSASPGFAHGSREGERAGRSVTPTRGGLGSSVPNQAAMSAFKQICPEDMHVIPLWRQGKSRLLVSSTLKELSASNAQLTEYPAAESETGFENDFVIGNLEEGLAGKVVVLQRTTQPLTSLSELLDKLQTV